MSDSIIVRVTLDSYDVIHPSEQQTQVYVQIPEVARAMWLLDADFYAVLKSEPWPHVVDSAQEDYSRRGTVSDSTSAAARTAVMEWLLKDENHDAMHAAWEADQARQHPVARKLLMENEQLRARIAELSALPMGAEPLALTEAQVEALAGAGNRVVNDMRHEDLCMCDAWPEACLSSGNFHMGDWDMSGLEAALPAVLALWEQMRGGELATLRARVVELEAERHTTNEALSDAAEKLRANRDRIAELEAAQGTVYRAEHPDSGITLGHYGTEAGARKHCEATERDSWPTGTTLVFDWIEDEEDRVAELVVTAGQNEESATGYIVTALDAPSEYDEEADE